VAVLKEEKRMLGLQMKSRLCQLGIGSLDTSTEKTFSDPLGSTGTSLQANVRRVPNVPKIKASETDDPCLPRSNHYFGMFEKQRGGRNNGDFPTSNSVAAANSTVPFGRRVQEVESRLGEVRSGGISRLGDVKSEGISGLGDVRSGGISRQGEVRSGGISRLEDVRSGGILKQTVRLNREPSAEEVQEKEKNRMYAGGGEMVEPVPDIIDTMERVSADGRRCDAALKVKTRSIGIGNGNVFDPVT